MNKEYVVVNRTSLSGSSQLKRGAKNSRRLISSVPWRRFIAAVAALAVALPTMSGVIGFNQPAAADDLTNTVPSNEGYSGTVNNIHGRSFTVDGVYQSNSPDSITSFGSALPLSTIYINQSKIWANQDGSIPVEDAIYTPLSTDPGVIYYQTAAESPTGKPHYVAYNPSAGNVELKAGQKNTLDGNLFSIRFPDAAEYTDANGDTKYGDVVFTYANAEIFIDQRYINYGGGKLQGLYSLATGAQPTWGTNDTTNLSSKNSDVNAVIGSIKNKEGIYEDGADDYSGNSNIASNNSLPEIGGSIDITISIVDKEGAPVPGTFAIATTGINLDRSPRRGAGNNVNKAMWYYYRDYPEYYYFAEAMRINSGQYAENVYVRNNDAGMTDGKPLSGFYPDVLLDGDGHVKFLSDATGNKQSSDGSYTSGFVTLGNAATGLTVTSTGHAGLGRDSEESKRLSAMNSPFFNSSQFWYKYKSATGLHGNIQITQEGNHQGDLSLTGSAQDAVLGQGTYVVMEGKTVTYTMTPDIGYKMKKLTVNGAEVKFDNEAVSKMKKGDTVTVSTAAGHDGILTYEENGTYTFKFEYAQHDEEIYVEWEPTTADILVAKIWDDENDKDGLRAAAYGDRATTPKVKLQWFVAGAWEDVPASVLPNYSANLDSQVVPDGKNASNKYLDGRYEIDRDTTGDHPFTWEYLPVYSYDSNGVADRLINYRIVEEPDLTSSDYKAPEYFDGQSFTLDASMTKSRDGFQLYTDGIANYIKKGDGKYYEVDGNGNPSANPAATQPTPGSLTGVTSNSYYTVDKGTPYQTVDVKNEHKPNEIFIEFTKNWNDAAIQNMAATDGNEYARKDLHFTLHGTIGTNGSTSVVDLNGDKPGEDIVVEISTDEKDAKEEATSNITVDGQEIVTDGTTKYVLRDEGEGEQYYTYADNTDGTYSYTVADPQPAAANLNPIAGDRTYKIDNYNFGALIENLPTHSEGKLISYKLTETDGAGNPLDGNGWIVTGGQLTPIYDSSGKLESYATQFVNTPVIDDTTSPLPITIQKKDKVTKGSLEGAVFTVYSNAINKTLASESATEETGGKAVHTDGTTKYVLQNDGGEDKYFVVGADGTVASAPAAPQPNPSNLTESKTTATETVDGQTVYTDGTTKYVLRSGEYYTYEDNGDDTYTYTKAANQTASTMRESQLKGAVDENEVVANANGQATINFNEPGTYYVVETKAPTGYEEDPTIYTFEVDKNLKSVTLKDIDDDHDMKWWEVIYELLFGNGTTLAENWTPSEAGKSGTLTVEDDPIRANILIDKVWDDNNNQDGLRNTEYLPEVKLEKTTNPSDETSWVAVNSQAVPAEDKVIPDHDAPITVDPDNYYTWGDLPAYENGKLLYYRVKEFGGTLPSGGVFLPSGDHPEEEGYAWTALTATGSEEEFNIANISDSANPTSRNRTVKVTNTHIPQTVNISVSKDWADDDDDTSGRLAANLTLYKTVNGARAVVDTQDNVVPRDDATSFYTWENLPAFDNGVPIAYTVEESAVPHYATTYKKIYVGADDTSVNTAGNSVDTSDIKRTWSGDGDTRVETTEATINIRNANLRELKVHKTWIDGANSNVTYKLYRTTSTDPAVIDWEQAKVGTPSISDPSQTLYSWNPDSHWEEVTGKTVDFAANIFSTSATGDRRDKTLEGLPKADAHGNTYTYRVWEDVDASRYEANQISNTEVVNTNIHATDGIANVNVVKELKGRDWAKSSDFSDRFYFKIEPYEDDGSIYHNADAYGLDAHGNKITDPAQVPMPKSGQNVQDIADVDKDDTQVGAIGRNVAFTPIEYTVTQVDMGQTAEYYYKVYEVYDAEGTGLDEATNHTGKKNGIAYAGEVEEGVLSDTFKPVEHTLKVAVSSDSTGKITTALFWDGKETQSAVPVYTNTYDSSAEIHAHVIKEVQGRDITGDDAFNFTITNMAGAPMRSAEDGTANTATQAHSFGTITADTGSQVQVDGDRYNPVAGDGGSYRAMRSDSSTWIKVSDLSQRTSDGKATDTFIYRLVENAGNAATNPSVDDNDDLNFDNRHIYLKVVATDNLDGTIKIEKSYWYDETCNTNQVGAQVLTVKTDSALAPAGSEVGDDYGYEPAAIFTNSQTIDIPVVKEWVGAPAVEDVTLRLQRKLIPLRAENGLTYEAVEEAAGDWENIGKTTIAPRGDFVNADGTAKYDTGSEDTASKTYTNIKGFNKDLPKYVTENGTTYRAVYKLLEDNTSDVYETTYRSKKSGAEDTAGNQIFIDSETLVVTNTVTASNEATIAAVKQLLGRQWLDSDDFEFTLKPAGKGTYNADGSFKDVDGSAEAKAAVPMPEDDTDRESVTTGVGADTVATTHAKKGDGTSFPVVDPNGNLERLARFGAIEFDINDLTWVKDHYEGDFFYTMAEKIPEGATDNGDGAYTKDGITYDKDLHGVHVKVTGNRTNQLYVQIAYDEKTVGDISTGAQFTPVYTNRYDAVGTQNAQIDKYVMGRDLVEGEAFTFKITPLGDTPMVDAATGERLDDREGTLTVSGTSAPQSLTLPDMKFILDDLPWTVGANSAPDTRDGATGAIRYKNGTPVEPGMKYGRFMYAFTETGASATDLNLDTDTEYVQVTVIDKGDGTLDTQVAYFEDRYGTTPRYTPNADGTPSATPATAAAFVNKLKRDLAVTKAWNAPATSDVTLTLQWSTDGTTWNDANGTEWLAGFDSTKTIGQDATGNALIATWNGLPSYAPDNDDIDLNDKWVRYRVTEDAIAHVTTRYSTEAYADGDEATDAKYSVTPIVTEVEDAEANVTQIYVTNFVDDLEGTASVNVVKQLIGRGWTDDDRFGFTITPVESKLGGENEATSADDRAMPMPMSTNGVDNTAIASTSSTKVTVGEYDATFNDIIIRLSDLALDPADNIAKGEFVYTIKETIPDGAQEMTSADGKTYYLKNNIKYTADEHTVKIVATNDGTGTIDTTVSYDGRPAGDFVPVYTNEAIVPTPIEGTKTWVGGEADEHINADEGVDVLGIALQRKTSTSDWVALTTDDAGRELVVVWENDTGNSGYSIKAQKVTTDLDTGVETTENVNPVLDTMDNAGGKYDYRIVEGAVPTDYAVSYTTTTIANDTITNTSAKTDSLKVTKTWDDEDNAEGLRPTKVVMHLYKQVADANGTTPIQVEVAKQEIANGGEATGVTWNDLPVYDVNGNTITYVVIEEAEYGYTTTYKVLGDPNVTGYTAAGNSLTLDGDTAAEVQTIDVKNTLGPATDTVSVTKVWDDSNDIDGHRPSSVIVNVYEHVWDKTANENAGGYVKNNTPVHAFTLDEAGSWTDSKSDLPKTKNGKTVFYTVGEDVSDTSIFGTPGTEGKYSNVPVVAGNQLDGFTVTNTYTPHEIDRVKADIVLHKINSATEENIGGVVFELKDSSGAVVGTYTTDTHGVAHINFEQIFDPAEDDPVATYIYTLTEKEPAVGFEANTDEYTITLETNAQGQPVIQKLTMKDTSPKNLFERLYSLIVSDEVNAEYDATKHILTVKNTPQASDVTVEKRFVDEDGAVIPHSIVSASGYKMHVSYTQLKDDGTGEKVTESLDLPNSATNGTYVWTLEDVVPGTNVHVHEQNYRSVAGYDFQGVTVTPTNATADIHTDDASFTMPLADNPVRIAFTNTYTRQTGVLELVKTWSDDNNQDGKRPDSVTFRVSADDAVAGWTESSTGSYKDFTLTKDSNALSDSDPWLPTFVENLPVFKDDGTTKILYTVSETTELPTGYTKGNSGAEYRLNAGETTLADILNSYTPATDLLTVTKVWNDSDDAAGLRPDSVTFHLYKADGTSAGVQAKTVSGNGSATWTNLPVYEDGEKITYRVVEEAVAGYSTGVAPATVQLDGVTGAQEVTVTNTLASETTSVTVTKNWNDGNNVDGLRPSSVDVNVYEYVWNTTSRTYVKNNTAVATLAVDAAGDWSDTVSNLPAIKNGKPVMYSVAETQVNGYDAPVVTGNQVDGFTVTNTHTPETGCVEVQKIWNDNNNQDGKRADVTVTLKATIGSGDDAESVEVGSKTISADVNTPQEAVWHDLPAFRDGQRITYTVEETAIDGYATTYSEGVQLERDGDIKTLTVTNTLTPATTTVTATKVWNDEDNQDGMRGDVTLHLKGTVAGSNITLNFEDKTVATGANHDENMSATWTDLPAYHNGQAITYTVSEEALPGYTATISGTTTDGFTVTNSRTPAVTDVTVTKVWDDNNNVDNKRTQVTVHLDKTVGGTTTEVVPFSRILATGTNHDQNMTTTWENLPAYEDGKRVIYTVREDAVAGYTTQITGDAENGYIIANTHVPETTSVTATKVWNDSELMKADGTPIEGYDRPKTVSLQLKADGTAVGAPVAVSKSSKVGNAEWAYQWADLPKYKESGTEIAYMVEEIEVPHGYTSEVTGNAADGFTVTNTPSVSEILGADLVVKKLDTATGKPMQGITFTLTSEIAGFTPVTKTTNDGGVAAFTFTKEGEYTLSETVPTGYENPAPASYTITVSKDSASTHVELEPSGRHIFQKMYDLLFAGGGANYDATAKILTVENTPKTSDVTVKKQFVDADTHTPISASAIPEDFEIHADYTALDENGVAVEQTAILKVSDAVLSDGAYVWTLEGVTYGTDVHVHEMTYTNVTGYDFKSTEVTAPSGTKIHGDDASFTMSDEDATVSFVNEYKKQTGSLELVKNWNDADNKDGERPQSVNFTVTASAPVFGTESNPSTTATVTLTGGATDERWRDTSLIGLPLYYNDTPVTYAVDEAVVAGYTKEIGQSGVTLTKGATETLSITNTYDPKTDSLTVTKVWDDNNDAAGLRPDSVTFHLYKADGTSAGVDAKTVNGNGSATWTGLPVHSADGTKITYKVIEEAVPGYTSSTVNPVTVELDGIKTREATQEDVDAGNATTVGETIAVVPQAVTVTNSLTAETTSVSVTKVWDDGNNVDGTREAATVTLYKQEWDKSAGQYGDPVSTGETKTLGVTDNASVTFNNLTAHANGKPVIYSVVEEQVEGYAAPVVTGDQEGGFTVTNTRAVNTRTITATKVWDDADMTAANYQRPKDISVNLFANGIAVGEARGLYEGNTWTTSWTVPVNDANGAIEYVVKELNTPTGYRYSGDVVVTGTGDQAVTITNTAILSEVQNPLDITVVKTNLKGEALQGATFALEGPNDYLANATSNADGKLTLTFPKDGTYTLTETNAPTGYKVNDTPITITVGKQLSEIELQTGSGLWANIYNLFVDGTPEGWDATSKTLTLTNEPQEFTLNVFKYFSGIEDLPNGFALKLTYTDAQGNAHEITNSDAYTVVYDNGVAVGKGFAFENIPFGGEVSVRELGYEVTDMVVSTEVTGATWDSYASGAGVTQPLEVDATSDSASFTMPNGSATVNFTNTYTDDTVSATVTKTWDDAGMLGIDGYGRPESVTVHVTGKDTEGNVLYEDDVTLTAENASGDNAAVWTKTVQLPTTIGGKIITYTASEDVPDGFTGDTQTENISGSVSIDVTNTPTVTEELTPQSITVVKKDEKTGVPLKGAEFTLTDPYGTEFEKTTGEDGTANFTLDAAGAWTLVETGVPEDYKLGDVYSWTITTKTSEDGVTVEKVTEGEDTFWKKIKGIFVDLTPDGFVAATNTLTVDNPPIDEKVITYVDPNPEDTSDVTTIQENTIKVGKDEPAQPANPTRDGYNFGGWLREMDNDGNVTYKANWIEIPDPGEKVIHYVDPSKSEGEQTVLREVITRGEDEPAQPADPTREGYRFTGWQRTINSETGDVTYTATWEEIPPAERVTVTYDSANGEDATEETINRNENEPVQPADPTRNGFTFMGWQRVEDEDGNVTYTAKWQEIPEAERISVTYDFDNGQDKVETIIERGEDEPAQPADPTLEGYVFGGWMREVDSDGNVTYKAKWIEKPAIEKITITRDPGNGEPPIVTEIERGEDEPAQPGDPLRDGYEFSGWDRTVDSATGNVLYTARWKTVELTDTVTVTYDPANGEAVSTATIERGDNEPGQPENPTREGYIFGGWLRQQDSETGNVTYTANWVDSSMCPVCPSGDPSVEPSPSDDPSSETIWVTYVDSDGTVYVEKTTVAKSGEEPQAPADPKREGYVFDGWERAEDDSGNITYTAKWTKATTPVTPDTPKETPSMAPTVSERPLSAIPLSNTGADVSTAGMAAFMLALLGGGLLALRRQRAMGEE